jgi:sigma-B regulation protein RsbU (phosphoserine phosphatase)
MLASVLESYRPQINALAQSWLARGAAQVSLWEGRRLQAAWPQENTPPGKVVAAPLIVDHQVVGELRVVGIDTPGTRERLAADAGLISALIPLNRDLNSLTEELVEARDQLVALYELTQVLRSSITLEQTMDLLTSQAAALVNAEKAFFFLRLPNGNVHTACSPEGWDGPAGLQHVLAELEQGSSPFVSIHRNDPRNTIGLNNLLIVPVQVAGVPFAAIGAADRPGDEFMSSDIKMLQTVARFAGASVENVRMVAANVELVRLRTEMDLAHQVQVSLLPEMVQAAPGFDLWAASQPASQVGGDFYDFIAAQNGVFTFVVCDVSGKGVPAALLMAMARSVIRTDLNHQDSATPAGVICHANEALYDDLSSLGRFATLFVGQILPGSGELVYANAGHSPVIFLPHGGRARLLQADGLPVGILRDTYTRDQVLPFDIGDVLVVGTDGLNEMRSTSGEMLGHERLMALLESLAHLPAREIAENLYTAVRDFGAGALPDDDQTLVVLKRTGV